jgi:hypothetical protein
MTPFDIAANVAAVALAGSRLVSALQPFWKKLPRALTVLAPVLVLALPQVADAAGLVTTEESFVAFVVTAIALLAPGVAEAVEAA